MKDLLELFWIFFKLGLFTFGGGYAMIPQIKEIIVEKKQWLTEEEMLETIAIAESTPGPLAINLATYTGYKKAKFLGSVMATIGVIIPSSVIIFIISLFLKQFMDNKYIQYAFIGIKACVAFLILKSAIEMIIKMEKNIYSIIALVVVTILMIVFEVFTINFSSIYFIIFGGIIGIAILFFCNLKSKKKGEETK